MIRRLIFVLIIEFYGVHAKDFATDRTFLEYANMFTLSSAGDILNNDDFDFKRWEEFALDYLRTMRKNNGVFRTVPLTFGASIFKGIVASALGSSEIMEELELLSATKYLEILMSLEALVTTQYRFLMATNLVRDFPDHSLRNFLERESDIAFFYGYLAKFLQDGNLKKVSDFQSKENGFQTIMIKVQRSIEDCQKRMTSLITRFAYKPNPDRPYKEVLAKWLGDYKAPGEFFPDGGRFDFAGRTIQTTLEALDNLPQIDEPLWHLPKLVGASP